MISKAEVIFALQKIGQQTSGAKLMVNLVKEKLQKVADELELGKLDLDVSVNPMGGVTQLK